MRVVTTLRTLRRERPWLALALALVVLAVALLVRLALPEAMHSLPFITLLPAVLIAAMIGGLHVGIVITILGGIAAWYWFLPPLGSFELTWPDGMLSLAFFGITAAVQLYVIRTLNLAVDQLSMERDQNEVLFQELQHRVANNLQFIASLLNFQRRNAASDPAASAKALEVAQNRLDLMARIHRRLYNPAATRMPLSEYFQGLCQEILEATGARNVVCLVEAAPVSFDLRSLMNVSLLLNEFVTNSVKHAFTGRQTGTVRIKLEQEGGSYTLTMSDDGGGVQDGVIDMSKGLGFTIMRSLAEQLHGEINFMSQNGVTTRITFPAAA
jgi:two-component sensor histidine kinase